MKFSGVTLFFASVHFCLSQNSPKNVLLIIVDDLRPALGAYGDKVARTPNVDLLASKGTVFNRAYTQQALCAPSRTSFLTSRRPGTTKLYDFYSYWRENAGNFTTLAQFFTENSYDTFSIGKVFHPGISSNFSDDMPYSWNMEPYHPSTNVYKNAAVCPGKDGRRHKNLLCAVDVESQPEKTLPDIQSTQEAVKFLKGRQKEKKPFFLAVGYHKPHVPFKFPKKYLDLFPLDSIPPAENPSKPKDMPDIAWNPWTDLRKREDIAALNLSFPFGPMEANHSLLIRQHYYAATSYADDLIGTTLEALGDKAKNTVVVLLGDHGWALGEHQEWAKFSNFEVSVRVPLIIHDPTEENNLAGFRKISAQRKIRQRFHPHYVSNEIVELLDLFPTLAKVTDLPQIPKCPSNSSSTLLCTEGKELSLSSKSTWPPNIHFAFSQYPRPSIEPRSDSDEPHLKNIRFMGYSVRSENYRYTEWVKFDSKRNLPHFNEIIARELYDHTNDALEDVNQIANWRYATVADILQRILHKQFIKYE